MREQPEKRLGVAPLRLIVFRQPENAIAPRNDVAGVRLARKP